MDDITKCIDLMRKQRHDFMNDFQIIYGYLQINDVDRAVNYLEKLSKENIVISSIYALGDNYFGFCFEQNIKSIIQKEYSVEANVEIEKFYKKFFEKDYIKKNNLVKNIFSSFENNSVKYIYIYIFEDKLGQSFLISNNESLIDELNWMENWDSMDVGIEELKLHKCSYENNLGYRVTFLL
ncbi:Spo0B domain-containing protein [Clostridium sp. JN-1]|jgi:sensor histidine kinase regulating citrate/malate metabolism|uniref:Spo0B domain-containing protein n=1 Tax=Clostridium sp. JN-1 TaxID=2483110 RepID=UPI000F0B914F|nr:Spo0B domain-containing protein [Clostridium sp. JN-1]